MQFFAPGIPQVYYVGMLAGANDIELVEKTMNGRDINRHSFSLDEIEDEIRRPVVARLLKLMKFRNNHPAFSGEFELIQSSPDGMIEIIRTHDDEGVRLLADMKSKEFQIYQLEGSDEWAEIVF